jgi:ribosomal protein S18 acetylase RimI-like enzyme
MNITYRTNMVLSDRDEIKDILDSTKFFYDFEVRVAIEIVDEYLNKGKESGYFFIIAEGEGKVLGYINYGAVPCTQTSWDIYWIAVRKDSMNLGLGKTLLKMAESDIKSMNGLNIWVETSGRKDYDPTRAFYLKAGYSVATELTDFYAPGDNKVIYHRKV